LQALRFSISNSISQQQALLKTEISAQCLSRALKQLPRPYIDYYRRLFNVFADTHRGSNEISNLERDYLYKRFANVEDPDFALSLTMTTRFPGAPKVKTATATYSDPLKTSGIPLTVNNDKDALSDTLKRETAKENALKEEVDSSVDDMVSNFMDNGTKPVSEAAKSFFKEFLNMQIGEFGNVFADLIGKAAETGLKKSKDAVSDRFLKVMTESQRPDADPAADLLQIELPRFEAKTRDVLEARKQLEEYIHQADSEPQYFEQMRLIEKLKTCQLTYGSRLTIASNMSAMVRSIGNPNDQSLPQQIRVESHKLFKEINNLVNEEVSVDALGQNAIQVLRSKTELRVSGEFGDHDRIPDHPVREHPL
jgi:hypothetical protein